MRFFGVMILLAAIVLTAAQTTSDRPAEYVLGPNDQILLACADSEELNQKQMQIDGRGQITVPLVGRVQAAGRTTQQLEAELSKLLVPFLRRPQVSITITQYASQPVSVIGAVNTPGVHYLKGRLTLIEVLSMAGGLRQDAGSTVKITRTLQQGRLPLKTAVDDPTGTFSIGEVDVDAVMQARSPEENIGIVAHDVISVPRAEMVYVIGDVVKPGGFVLNEKKSVSVLQALALAGGALPTAAPHNAKILRAAGRAPMRTDIAVDVKRILAGRSKDVPLNPDDILFIPSSGSRKAAVRAVEAAIQTITGVAIWRSAR